MASAEARAAYAVRRCFNQDFGTPSNSSDHPTSDSKSLESDWTQSNSVNDRVNSCCMPHNRNSDKLPDMKWWLHVKTNLGGEENYTCQHLNSWESDLDPFSSLFVNDNLKIGRVQSVKSFNAVSCIGSPNAAVEQPWNVSPKCVTKNNDTKLPKIETARNNDLHLKPKEKDQGDFWLTNDQFVDSDTNFMVSGHFKRTSSDLEPQWIGAKNTRPWWCTAGKDELVSLISQNSLEETENCDLPPPQVKHCSDRPSLYTKGVDHDKNLPSSLNQKVKIGSSISNGYTSGTMTSSCSFHDTERVLSSSQSKDSDSSSKDDQTISENNCKDELLKALCHSQTRAREAEIAAQQAYNEKEHILSLFFRQASQLFAYKQWLHLLQLENLCLQLRNKNQPLLNLSPASFPYKENQLKKNHHHRDEKRKIRRRRCGIRKYAVAFALGFGLASAGFFLGWTMGWMFPPL